MAEAHADRMRQLAQAIIDRKTAFEPNQAEDALAREVARLSGERDEIRRREQDGAATMARQLLDAEAEVERLRETLPLIDALTELAQDMRSEMVEYGGPLELLTRARDVLGEAEEFRAALSAGAEQEKEEK